MSRRDRDDEKEEKREEVKFDWVDVLAFTIAAFEIILPILAAFIGVVLLVYLLLRLLAR
jgi:hypothetical protein